jgi:hypothetical protein
MYWTVVSQALAEKVRMQMLSLAVVYTRSEVGGSGSGLVKKLENFRVTRLGRSLLWVGRGMVRL